MAAILIGNLRFESLPNGSMDVRTVQRSCGITSRGMAMDAKFSDRFFGTLDSGDVEKLRDFLNDLTNQRKDQS